MGSWIAPHKSARLTSLHMVMLLMDDRRLPYFKQPARRGSGSAPGLGRCLHVHHVRIWSELVVSP
jgi:hypothetical protein